VSAPEPRSPFAGHLAPGRHGAAGDAGVTLQERRASVVEIVALRGGEGAVAAACRDAFGAEPPAPGRSTGGARTTLLGLGPSNWLVVAPPDLPGALAADLRERIGQAALVADQSAGFVLLRVAGARARETLAKGCRVDLHPREFGPGRVARTPIAQVGTVLRQVDDAPRFDLLTSAITARSFAEFLLHAAAEFGVEVLPPAPHQEEARTRA
jgi:sarcosine oxidase subunit gamma